MKKILFVMCAIISSYTFGFCQGNGIITYPNGTVVTYCSIKYSYDAAGNRTNRIYSCSTIVVGGSSARLPNKVDANKGVESIVFPNPSNGIFMVKTNIAIADATVLVLDGNGSVIKKFAYNGAQSEYDIRTLALGQYMIQLVMPDGKQVHQLLKNE
jgi:Secretion system C-terminal sorting domain